MQVNCILEAFGHAKTPRNSNSSRFIKLLTIQYCEKTKMMLRGNLDSCHSKTSYKLISFVSFNLTMVLFFPLTINILDIEVHNRSIEPIMNHANLLSGDFFSSEHYSQAPAGGSKSPLVSHIVLWRSIFFYRQTHLI